MAKLLNQGAYGCVYYPGFTPKGNVDNNKGYVTKLEVFDKTSKNEINISTIIKKIKNYNKYFSPIVKYYITSFKQLNKYNDKLKDCEAINLSENIYNNFILIYIKYINGSSIEKYLLNIDISTIYLNRLINSYIYLNNSIKLLINNNIIHYDLHTENILYDKKKDKPIIIDFGLSINIKDIITNKNNIDYIRLKKATMHFSPKHYTYPPELHFMTYILTDINIENHKIKLNEKISKQEIHKFINELIETNKIHRQYIYIKHDIDKKHIDKEIYKKELINYYNKFISKTKKESIDDLIKYINILDIYSITVDMCIIIIKILNKTFINTDYTNETLQKILFFILEILIFNLQIDPEKRLSIAEISIFYNKVFKSNYDLDMLEKSLKSNTILYKKYSEMKKYYISPNFSILNNRNIQSIFKTFNS